jgi:hypothetical protein
MGLKKDIRYLNRDFEGFRENLIKYTKTYFPSTFNDFSPSSPGMMLMELSAYVGDVLSFYLDNQVQETFLQYARQENNLFELAYMFGYKPKVTKTAQTIVDVYQQVPATIDGKPDYNYALFIEPNFTVQSDEPGVSSFLVEDSVNFAFSSSQDPTEVTVFEVDSNGDAEIFLLKKQRKAISAAINIEEFSFGDFEEFPTRDIQDSNIIGVLDIIDENGNKWYEVDYLAQDTVFDSIRNNPLNNSSNIDNDVNDILKLKKVQRRFVTRFISPTDLQIQFGSGDPNSIDEEIIPNLNNVGVGLPFERNKMTTAYSPTNFLFTNSYGIAPSNINLTVRYLTGGGVSSNADSNQLNIFNGVVKPLNSGLANIEDYIDTLGITNSVPADGGGEGDSIRELRENTISQINTQQRTITKDDYVVRALSMPSRFGSIEKIFVDKSKPLEDSLIDLYILSSNNENHLTIPSNTLKQNLKTYLSQFNDNIINIKNAFIINIGIEFEIVVLPDFNSNEVLEECINELQSYFNIKRWQINQPILLREINILLDKVEGVQTVNKVKIINKTSSINGYSNFAYDIDNATINNIVYPSLDPMIFEVKFPDIDIQGRTNTF